MPHTCRNLWTPQMQDLKQALDYQTGVHPLGGWAYRLDHPAQFEEVLVVYLDLCLALGQATDEPGQWAPHGSPLEYGQARVNAVDSAILGTRAAAMRACLLADGQDVDQSVEPHVMYHPSYGVPNWLGMESWDPQSYQLAGNLLLSLRNALDR